MNTPPRDVTAHHGSTTTLTCDVEIGEDERDILEWSKLASNPDTGADEYIYVSLDNQMRPVSQASDPEKYTIEGHYDLVIHDVMFDDAGVYQCRLVLSRQQGTANVIVLGECIIITIVQARVQGRAQEASPPLPTLKIEKQKKKIIRANFKLFHL